MADNVLLPATGTGTGSITQATDDVSGVHYPKVKLADGTADSSTVVAVAGGAAANALRVVPATDSPHIHAEDALFADGHYGALMVGVNNATGHAAFTTTPLDYVPINVDAEGCVVVVGNKAHDGTDADGPVKIGGKAISSVTAQTVVAADDRSNAFVGLDGVLLTRPYTTLADCQSERLTATATAEVASTAFSAAAGIRSALTNVMIYNTSTTVSTFVDVLNGSGGTVLATMPAPAGGGSVITLPVPLISSPNTAFYVKANAAATTLYITLVGFRSKA